MFESISYSDVILTFILALMGIVTFKFKISFDLNLWLKERKKERKQMKIAQLQNMCPHASLPHPKSFSPILEYSRRECTERTGEKYNEGRGNKIQTNLEELGL